MIPESGWLLLLIALGVGWGVGYFMRHSGVRRDVDDGAGTAVKHRLQLLFDSYSDDALDRFIHSLEVNPETLSLHISIGKHFRTEGEVEKAILIHQNLMSHPELPRVQSEPVVYELAKDYKVAGLFDRAEALLKQLMTSKAFGDKSKKLLLDILELEKDWDQALEVCAKLDLKKHPGVRRRMAQYCCEMAEIKNHSGEPVEAKRFYDKALATDKACARAHLGAAQHYINMGQFREAIVQLKTLIDRVPEYFLLAKPLLLECTKASQSHERYRAYLKELYQETRQVNVMLALVEAYMRESLFEEAFEYLEQEASEKPSFRVLEALIEARKAKGDLQMDSMWRVLTGVIDKVRLERPEYCCVNCGFAGKQLHWMCPSCKSWETVRPFVEYDANA